MAGMVTKEPPPAAAFIAPASNADVRLPRTAVAQLVSALAKLAMPYADLPVDVEALFEAAGRS
jgi:hypothetical protein